MPATPQIIDDILDLLAYRLSIHDIHATPPDTLDRLAVQLEFWLAMTGRLDLDTGARPASQPET